MIDLISSKTLHVTSRTALGRLILGGLNSTLGDDVERLLRHLKCEVTRYESNFKAGQSALREQIGWLIVSDIGDECGILTSAKVQLLRPKIHIILVESENYFIDPDVKLRGVEYVSRHAGASKLAQIVLGL